MNFDVDVAGRLSAGGRACPVPGCDRCRANQSLAMCLKHWRCVPRDLQTLVYAAWNGGRPANWVEYRKARAAAIAAAQAGDKNDG